jgi:hypothetical protein
LRGSSRSLAGPARGSNRSRTPGSEDCVRLAIAPLSSFAQTAWIFLAIDSDCLSGNNKMISNGYERRRSFAGLFAAAIRGWPGRAGLCKSSTPRLLKRRGETLPSSPCFSRVIEECNELRGDGRFRCMRSHGPARPFTRYQSTGGNTLASFSSTLDTAATCIGFAA